MPGTPSLPDLIAVIGVVGGLIGGCVGLFLPGEGRQIAENVALCGTLGGIIGGAVGLAIGAGLAAGGA
jgi:hypothetical protein